MLFHIINILAHFLHVYFLPFLLLQITELCCFEISRWVVRLLRFGLSTVYHSLSRPCRSVRVRRASAVLSENLKDETANKQHRKALLLTAAGALSNQTAARWQCQIMMFVRRRLHRSDVNFDWFGRFRVPFRIAIQSGGFPPLSQQRPGPIRT